MHVKLYTHAFYGVIEEAITQSPLETKESLEHFNEWHFTDICCPSMKTSLEQYVTIVC